MVLQAHSTLRPGALFRNPFSHQVARQRHPISGDSNSRNNNTIVITLGQSYVQSRSQLFSKEEQAYRLRLKNSKHNAAIVVVIVIVVVVVARRGSTGGTGL